MNRNAAVSGQFYPFYEAELRRMIENFLINAKTDLCEPIAGVVPHAGYVYSGQTASYFYKTLQNRKINNVIILGPNHTGMGEPISIYPNGIWETPLGEVKVNEKLASKLFGKPDEKAHIIEHSIEVQVPFLQYILKNKFEIVPICLMDQSKESMEELGKSIFENAEKNDIVIASTDFSHYIDQNTAYKKDIKAINCIKALDIDALYNEIDNGLTMCGYGGVAATIEYAKLKKIKDGKLLKYTTSAETTGDVNQVVGYGAIEFE